MRGRREMVVKQLFSKNTGLCKTARRNYGADACQWKVKGEVSASETELKPHNGGRNYNGPKVAKFLVG